jgi:hypothetical protein
MSYVTFRAASMMLYQTIFDNILFHIRYYLLCIITYVVLSLELNYYLSCTLAFLFAFIAFPLRWTFEPFASNHRVPSPRMLLITLHYRITEFLWVCLLLHIDLMLYRKYTMFAFESSILYSNVLLKHIICIILFRSGTTMYLLPGLAHKHRVLDIIYELCSY